MQYPVTTKAIIDTYNQQIGSTGQAVSEPVKLMLDAVTELINMAYQEGFHDGCREACPAG